MRACFLRGAVLLAAVVLLPGCQNPGGFKMPNWKFWEKDPGPPPLYSGGSAPVRPSETATPADISQGSNYAMNGNSMGTGSPAAPTSYSASTNQTGPMAAPGGSNVAVYSATPGGGNTDYQTPSTQQYATGNSAVGGMTADIRNSDSYSPDTAMPPSYKTTPPGTGTAADYSGGSQYSLKGTGINSAPSQYVPPPSSYDPSPPSGYGMGTPSGTGVPVSYNGGTPYDTAGGTNYDPRLPSTAGAGQTTGTGTGGTGTSYAPGSQYNYATTATPQSQYGSYDQGAAAGAAAPAGGSDQSWPPAPGAYGKLPDASGSEYLPGSTGTNWRGTTGSSSTAPTSYQ